VSCLGRLALNRSVRRRSGKGTRTPNTRRSRRGLNDDPFKNVSSADHHPITTGDERERLVAASPVMETNWGPSWGKQ
jgi:hypothetical protein